MSVLKYYYLKYLWSCFVVSTSSKTDNRIENLRSYSTVVLQGFLSYGNVIFLKVSCNFAVSRTLSEHRIEEQQLLLEYSFHT
jgi:hypothetical protein